MTGTKDNGPDAPHAQPDQTTITTDPIVGVDIQDRNQLATLKARAGRAGHTLIEGHSGYLLTKWGLVIHCTDLDTVSAALLRMGVKP